MKIWTVTENSDNGIITKAVTSQAAADALERQFLLNNWWSKDTPLPDDMETARDAVYAQAGMVDSVHVVEHDIDLNADDDPTIIAAYRKAARELHQKDGTCEIDDGATVSMGDDPGAYVQAWVWVPDDDAGIHHCDECGIPYIEGDDSFCGKCADCADTIEDLEDMT